MPPPQGQSAAPCSPTSILIRNRKILWRLSDRKGLSNPLERRFLHDALETVLLALDSALKPGPIVGEEACDPEGFFSRSQTDLMENIGPNRKLCVAVSVFLRDLIRRMSLENPLGGAPRIHGELLKLGTNVAQSTVSIYKVPRQGRPLQRWKSFLSWEGGGIH
jgi:hypothetical protein